MRLPALTSIFLVELPGIEPVPEIKLTCGITKSHYAKRRESTWEYPKGVDGVNTQEHLPSRDPEFADQVAARAFAPSRSRSSRSSRHMILPVVVVGKLSTDSIARVLVASKPRLHELADLLLQRLTRLDGLPAPQERPVPIRLCVRYR